VYRGVVLGRSLGSVNPPPAEALASESSIRALVPSTTPLWHPVPTLPLPGAQMARRRLVKNCAYMMWVGYMLS